jgi:hypothetical protein
LRVENKAAVRTDLERTFGYTYSTIYPDLPGFATHASTLSR